MEEKILKALYIPTEGKGDCFFHATFGKLNKDLGYICTDKAFVTRKKYCDFLSEFIPIGNVDKKNIPNSLRHQLEVIFSALLDDISKGNKSYLINNDFVDKLRQEYIARIAAINTAIEKFKSELSDEVLQNKSNAQKIIDLLKSIPNFDLEKFKKDEKYRAEMSITSLKEIAGQINNMSDDAYNKSLSLDYARKEFVERFFNNKDYIQCYLDSVNNNQYYISTEEIPLFAGLARLPIYVYHIEGKYLNKNLVYSKEFDDWIKNPSNSWVKKYFIENSNNINAHIFHSGLHYSRASNVLINLFKNNDVTKILIADIESSLDKENTYQPSKVDSKSDSVIIEVVQPIFKITERRKGSGSCSACGHIFCGCLYRGCGWWDVFGFFTKTSTFRIKPNYDEEYLRAKYRDLRTTNSNIDENSYLQENDAELLLQKSRRTYYDWGQSSKYSLIYTTLVVALIVGLLEAIRIMINGLNHKNAADLTSNTSIIFHFVEVAVPLVGAFIERYLSTKYNRAYEGFLNTERQLKKLGFTPLDLTLDKTINNNDDSQPSSNTHTKGFELSKF